RRRHSRRGRINIRLSGALLCFGRNVGSADRIGCPAAARKSLRHKGFLCRGAHVVLGGRCTQKPARTPGKARGRYVRSGLYTLKKAVTVLGSRALPTKRTALGRELREWRASRPTS